MTFEDRINEIAEPLGGITQLALGAGLARATIYHAINREKAEGRLQIDQSTAVALAKVSGRSVAWILGEPGPVIDTLSMAKEATQRIAQLGTWDANNVWLVMREVPLSNPSVERFTIEATRRLLDTEMGTVPSPEGEEQLSVPPGPQKSKRKKTGNK